MWEFVVKVVGGLLLILALFFFMVPEILFTIIDGDVSKKGSPSTHANLPEGEEELKSLVGRSGRSESPLQLAGKIEVDGKLYEAISDDGFVERGTDVRVMDIRGKVVVVERIED